MDDRTREVLCRAAQKHHLGDETFAATKEYLTFLHWLGLDALEGKVLRCGRRLRYRECTTNPKHRGLCSMRCGQRGCSVCDYIRFRGQTEDMVFVMESLMAAAKVPFYVFCFDFTMASDLWSRVRRDKRGLSRLGRLAYRALRRYFTEVWGFPVEIACDLSVQFWHSGNRKDDSDDERSPGDGYFPHVHAEVPRLFVEKKTGLLVTGGKRGVQLRWINESRIKELWRFACEQAYSKSSAVVACSSAKFVVHLSRTNWRGHPKAGKGLDKRLRYAYRGPTKDVEDWIRREGLTIVGGLMKDWDKDWMRWMLTFNHKRHQGYGLLAAKNLSSRSSFMKMLGLDLGTSVQRARLRRHVYCPDCLNNHTQVGNRLVADPILSDTHVDFGKDAREMSYSEAKATGLNVWRTVYEDEAKKQKDFVAYKARKNASWVKKEV